MNSTWSQQPFGEDPKVIAMYQKRAGLYNADSRLGHEDTGNHMG